MSCSCELAADSQQQKNVLITLLTLNLGMFFVEIIVGIMGDSAALLADSLDMLADAIVYTISLYAVSKTTKIKINSAIANGGFQMLIGLGLIVEFYTRLLYGSDPESILMVSFGLLALIVNVTCFMLISRHQNDEIHMRASWICSRNDVIANVCVIIAGVLVMTTNSYWPDLIIGTLIVAVVLNGAFTIFREAFIEHRASQGANNPIDSPI